MGPHLPGAGSRQEGEAGDILKGIAVGERWAWGSSSLSSLAVVLVASTGKGASFACTWWRGLSQAQGLGELPNSEVLSGSPAFQMVVQLHFLYFIHSNIYQVPFLGQAAVKQRRQSTTLSLSELRLGSVAAF